MTTISIVTWNSADTIVDCIESVLRQSHREFELIVTDNMSHDDTCALVACIKDPRVRLERLPKNTGFCGGHNHAICGSSGEFILLVNPDVRLTSNYLSTAIDRIRTDDRIGTVCGLLLRGSQGTPDCRIDSAGMAITADLRCRLRYHGEIVPPIDMSVEEVFGADGALPLYRREMVEDIMQGEDFFDPMFFTHKEDWDVAWRARWRGWKTILDPTCVAIHPRAFKPESLKVRSAMSPEIRYHALKNQMILLLKNVDLLTFIMRFPVIVLRQLSIFMFVMVCERESLSAYIFVAQHFRGIVSARRRNRLQRKVSPNEMRKFLSGDFA